MDKNTLIKSRAAFQTAEVEVAGGSVKVRALTRAEVLDVRGLSKDPAKFERRLLSYAMVEPKLTEAEVKLWQENSTVTEIEDVTDKVMELSGLKDRAERADKSRLQEDGD